MIELDGVWLKRSLGIILLLMALQRIWANCHAPRPPSMCPQGLDLRNWRVQLSILFWFTVAGLMGGITSIGGPPVMIFVSIYQDEIDFRVWRGSSAVARLVINIARATE